MASSIVGGALFLFVRAALRYPLECQDRYAQYCCERAALRFEGVGFSPTRCSGGSEWMSSSIVVHSVS